MLGEHADGGLGRERQAHHQHAVHVEDHALNLPGGIAHLPASPYLAVAAFISRSILAIMSALMSVM